MTEKTTEKIIVILDSIGRTIAGVLSGTTQETIGIKNPVIVHAMPGNNSQMSLQLIPLFFREVLEDQNQDCIFYFNKDSVATTNIEKLNKHIALRYFELFKEIPTIVTPKEEGKVVDLFEK